MESKNDSPLTPSRLVFSYMHLKAIQKYIKGFRNELQNDTRQQWYLRIKMLTLRKTIFGESFLQKYKNNIGVSTKKIKKSEIIY